MYIEHNLDYEEYMEYSQFSIQLTPSPLLFILSPPPFSSVNSLNFFINSFPPSPPSLPLINPTFFLFNLCLY